MEKKKTKSLEDNTYSRSLLTATLLICFISILTACNLYAAIFTTSYPKLECDDDHDDNFQNKTFNDNKQTSCSLLVAKGEAASNESSCKFNFEYGHTIITEWNLVCSENRSISNMLFTLYMIGSLFSIVFGFMSDRIGRKRTIIILLALISVVKTANQLLQSFLGPSVALKYSIYLAGEFFSGLFNTGLMNVMYVLLYEITPSKYIVVASNANWYFFVLGEIIVMLVSYATRNWHFINWFLAVYSLGMFILSYFFLPESARYRLIKQEASLKARASQNEVRGLGEEKLVVVIERNDEDEDEKRAMNVFQYIFKSKEIFIRTALISFVWFSLPLVYLGISLGKHFIFLVI
jgi:OCT family organic cation transporter-like MFS transporter 1